CDVLLTGESLLVSRGLFNLAHRHGHDRTDPLTPGEPVAVSFPLDFAGHRFAPGHRIRLSLSPTYWPFAWPSPEPVTLTVAPAPLPPGEPVPVSSPLAFAGPRFAPGHRIRLSLSPTYWPFAWPSPEPVTLTVALGELSSVSLPGRDLDAADEAPLRFGPPEEL